MQSKSEWSVSICSGLGTWMVMPEIIANSCSNNWGYPTCFALQNADQETVNKYGNHPVAIALKLERYKETDFSSFKDYKENVSFIDNWLGNPPFLLGVKIRQIVSVC